MSVEVTTVLLPKHPSLIELEICPGLTILHILTIDVRDTVCKTPRLPSAMSLTDLAALLLCYLYNGVLGV